MRTDKVRAYWFEMWKKHEQFEEVQDSDYFNLEDLTNTGTAIDQYTSIFDFFGDIREDLVEDVFVGENDEKTLSVLEWEHVPDENLIEGVFAKGRSGRREDHLPIDKAKEPDNTPEEVRERDALDEDTAAEERYYFLIYVPPSEPRKALMIMHLHGVGGVVSLLRQKVRQKLEEIDEDIKFETRNIAGKSIIDQLEDQPIVGFDLVKKGVDTREHLGLSDDIGNSANEAKVEVNISATSGDQWELSRGEIKRLSGKDDFDYGEILPSNPEDDTSFEPDKTKLKAEQNGRTRTFDLSKERATVEVELFPRQLEYVDGRLSMRSVGKEARRIANETLDREGISLLDTDESALSDPRTDG